MKRNILGELMEGVAAMKRHRLDVTPRTAADEGPQLLGSGSTNSGRM